MLEATIKSMTEGMQELERQLSEMQVNIQTNGFVCHLRLHAGLVSPMTDATCCQQMNYLAVCLGLQTKYGIKLVDRQGRPVDEPPPSSSSAAAADKEGGKAGAGSSGRGPQGVLVQK
jgi:hypothetical protein